MSTLFITSCSSNNSMKPEDFKDKKPRLIIEDYLSGQVKAWGVLQNRSGKVTRQFSAILDGKWDGQELILDETFILSFSGKTIFKPSKSRLENTYQQNLWGYVDEQKKIDAHSLSTLQKISFFFKNVN